MNTPVLKQSTGLRNSALSNKLDFSSVLTASETATKNVPTRYIGNVMLQLASETGEACDWINRPHRQKEDFAGECADILNCVLDAMWLHYRPQYSHLSDEKYRPIVLSILQSQLELKTEKWMGHINASV